MGREGSEPSTYLSHRVGPWVAGFAKAGSIFWARFGARHTETFACGVGLGAAWRTQLWLSCDFFFMSLAAVSAPLRPHLCLGPSFGAGLAWSRVPSCRLLRRGRPRLLRRSEWRRKATPWRPRSSAWKPCAPRPKGSRTLILYMCAVCWVGGLAGRRRSTSKTGGSKRPEIANNRPSIPLPNMDWAPGCDVRIPCPLRLASSLPLPLLVIPLVLPPGLSLAPSLSLPSPFSPFVLAPFSVPSPFSAPLPPFVCSEQAQHFAPRPAGQRNPLRRALLAISLPIERYR